jgi:hypothetical protein
MAADQPPLFTPAALAVLDGLPYDPAARSRYELMSGALIWSDEVRAIGSPEGDLIWENWVFRYLVGYRASLTLGQERSEFRPVWEQVVRHAPNWPGLRPVRYGDRARRRLLAAKRLNARCFDAWDRLLEPRSGGRG